MKSRKMKTKYESSFSYCFLNIYDLVFKSTAEQLQFFIVVSRAFVTYDNFITQNALFLIHLIICIK